MKLDARVLDSWAILAWMQNEPGASAVEALFARSDRGTLALHCSAINAGEVYYQLARRGRNDEAERFWTGLIRGEAPIRAEAVTIPRIKSAARIKGRYPLAYADAFAIALAQELGCPLVTGDPEVRAPGSDGIVTVEWLGTA
ncbi:MAG: type II toxin-antitoxin system VapC family toxin [Candidatus Dormibacteraceae bacterium]